MILTKIKLPSETVISIHIKQDLLPDWERVKRLNLFKSESALLGKISQYCLEKFKSNSVAECDIENLFNDALDLNINRLSYTGKYGMSGICVPTFSELYAPDKKLKRPYKPRKPKLKPNEKFPTPSKALENFFE